MGSHRVEVSAHVLCSESAWQPLGHCHRRGSASRSCLCFVPVQLRGAFLLVWYDTDAFPPFCITLCHTFHLCPFYPVCLSFSVTEMMCCLTKTQLHERCSLAQLLPIHQKLFQPFISRKFCSLPKGLDSQRGPVALSGAAPPHQHSLLGPAAPLCPHLQVPEFPPAPSRSSAASGDRSLLDLPAAVFPLAQPDFEKRSWGGQDPSFQPGQAGIFTLQSAQTHPSNTQHPAELCITPAFRTRSALPVLRSAVTLLQFWD